MRRLGVLLGTLVVAALLGGCGSGGSSTEGVDTSPLSEQKVEAGLKRAEEREAAAVQRQAVENAHREAVAAAAAEEAERELEVREVEEAERGAQEERQAEEEADPGAVSKDEFGKEWPLTVASGELECQGSAGVGSVVFIAPDGTHYGLNGTAQDQLGLPPIDPIWRYDPELKEYGLKANIGPLLDRGLALCE